MTNLIDLTQSPYAILAPLFFGLSYCFVIAEEFLQLRKSKPMLIGSGILWILVALIAQSQTTSPESLKIISTSLEYYLSEYGQLLLFILVAMTYVNVMQEYNVFYYLQDKLTQKKLSFRQLFWITGILTFFISSIADNLTTAIALSSVVIAVAKLQNATNHRTFLTLACLNVVIAANAGGVFSPFGDITTLMVWQAGILPFTTFLKLFFPAVINFLIPAICMHFAIPKGCPIRQNEEISLKPGAITIIVLFLFTIFFTVVLRHFLNLPPVIGMMFGLGILQVFAYYSRFSERVETFNIFPIIQRVEWDTLLFFYGVILSVGALSTLGYFSFLSNFLYTENSPTLANTLIGILSALVDNIPVMYAVITMNPSMSEGQWLLVTLTTGVGGSLLAIGSAAGVALMGQARGVYTFFSHLKWSMVILLGYFASIVFHLWWNADLF